MELVDIVVDSERAVAIADLTDHQRKVVNLRWIHGFTQSETARFYGVSQSAISQSEKLACNRVNAVLKEWGSKT